MYTIRKLTVAHILASVLLSYFVSSLELKEFESRDEFLKFYEDWMRIDDAQEFRRIENEFSQILTNKSADPCEDFYEYACGGWRDTFPQSMKNNFHSLGNVHHFAGIRLMETVYKNEFEDTDSELNHKMKLLYQTCMDRNAWRFSDLGDFIGSLGSWPVLTEHWDSSKFDWAETSARMDRYGLTTFYRMFHDVEEGTLGYGIFRSANIHGTLDSAGDLSEVNFSRFRFSEEEVIAVRKFYEQINAIPYTGRDPRCYRLTELKALFPTIHQVVQKYMQLLKGKDTIDANQTVILHDENYFEVLSDLLVRTEPRIVAHFMFVQVVMQTMEIIKLSKDIPWSCRKFLSVENVLGVRASYMAKYHFGADSTEQLVSIFNGIRERVRESAEVWGESEDTIKELANYTLRLPMFMKYNDEIEESYASFHVNRSSFVWTYFHFQETMMKEHLRLLLSISFYYNKVEILSGLLDRIWYRSIFELYPLAFHRYSSPAENYASVGRQMAGALLNERISASLIHKLSPKVECLFSQLGKELESDVVRSITIDVESLKVAYDALQNRLKDHQQEQDLRVDQQFFLRFAQTKCGPDEETKAKRIGSGGVLDILTNSAEFSAAYKCPIGSKLNPPPNC